MYRGIVSRADESGIWVTAPDVVPGVEFGPCEWIGTTPAEGADVLLADLGEAQSPDLVIVGTLVSGGLPS